MYSTAGLSCRFPYGLSITALHRVKHRCSAPQLKVLSVMLGSDEHKANDPTSLLQPPLSRDVMISGFC